MTATPPPLDSLTGEWLTREELAHLHSLRNQWGQAHVNGDLTSISWLAIPPFSGGYHSGVLRVNGRVPAADRFSWAPWGVLREGSVDGIRVRTDTRMGFEQSRVFWRVTATNETDAPQSIRLDQEVVASVAHSEVDWGWLYGTPWNAGHYHDYYATERVRSEALADEPEQRQLLPHDPRSIRLGRPRLPGIQRDEDDAPMLLDSALPSHFTGDVERVRPDAVVGEVSDLELVTPEGDRISFDGPHRILATDDEVRLAAVLLEVGTVLAFTFVAAEARPTGVILTHGNHPDSLQVGVDDGRPWLAIGGERVQSDVELTVDQRIEVQLGADRAVLRLDGVEVARTEPWWHGTRWNAARVDQRVLVVDSASIARSSYGFAPAPDEISIEGARGSARWDLLLEPGESATVSFSLNIGTDAHDVLADAAAWASTGDDQFDQVAGSWRSLWDNAFRPGNPDHSGYLPVLEARWHGLARSYYFGILLALYMRNTGVSPIGPVFLTGGPRLGATTTFYWDLSEWARTASLLEPVGIRSWILAALAQPYDASHSFDTKNLLPVGNHYAANDHALFRIVEG